MFQEGQLYAPVVTADDGEVTVHLAEDHPGFADAAYRERRNTIAALALDWTAGDPCPVAPYTDEEHEVWRVVSAELAVQHERLACRAAREGRAALDLPLDRIPQLDEVTAALAPLSGFEYRPAAGLVPLREFYGSLADRAFWSTQYIRHHSVPLYTPEPDVVHELVGHAASLFHPGIVKLSRRFGEAAWRVDDAALKRLELVYWYTLEFGLVEEGGERKAVGAGLLSSFGELGTFEANAEIRPLDCEEAASIPYDPTQYQKLLYVSSSFERMVEDVCTWLDRQ